MPRRAGIGLEALDDDAIAAALAASDAAEARELAGDASIGDAPSGPQPTSTSPLRAAT